jgi:hypothetical protein
MDDKWTRTLPDGRVATYTVLLASEEIRKRYGDRENMMHSIMEEIDGIETRPPLILAGPPKNRTTIEKWFEVDRKEQERIKEMQREHKERKQTILPELIPAVKK